MVELLLFVYAYCVERVGGWVGGRVGGWLR